MPVPATAQAIRAPATPVSCANRRGSEKTPAPTIEPTTIAVRVRSVSLAAGRGGASAWLMVSLVDAVIGQPGKASNMSGVLSRNGGGGVTGGRSPVARAAPGRFRYGCG